MSPTRSLQEVLVNSIELLQLYYAFHNALLNSSVISKINSTTNNEQVSQYGTKWEEN